MYAIRDVLSHVQLTGDFGTLHYLKECFYFMAKGIIQASILCSEEKRKSVYSDITIYESHKIIRLSLKFRYRHI